MPLPPVQANQQKLSLVQGTMAQRKLKVKNIDPRVVTGQDLQKLFSKSGPLIKASFDTNEFGQFLGTATVIYSKASAAARAIKDYHLA
jgi:RNA recognition motif-containing protein